MRSSLCGGRGDAIDRYHNQISRELNGSKVSSRKEFEYEQKQEIKLAKENREIKDLKTL